MFHHISQEIDVVSLAQDTEVAIIVQQIEHHEREILTLRERLNQHLPAARIPDDILVEIFSHSLRLIRQSFWEWRAEISPEEKRACPEKLTHWPVILVCQRWRSLVMDNPRLSSFITSYDKPGYVHNALARSANAGLQLRLAKHSSRGDQDVFNALLEQLSRAHSLEYQFDATPWRWGNPQPHLGPIRSLSLVRGPYDFGDESDPLAKHLATTPLPHLGTLYFKDVPSDVCTILPRPMLTFLEIDTAVGRPDGTRLETGMLITSLVDLPLLEVLCLTFPSLPKSLCKIPDSQLPDVHLERLQELKLSTQTDACLLLLSHLSFPPRANISVSTSGVWAQHNDAHLGNSFWFTQERADSSLIDKIMQRLKTLKLDYWRPPYQLLLRDDSPDDPRAKHTTIQIRPQSGDALNIQISHRNVDQVVGHLPFQNVEAIEFENTSRSLPTDPSDDHDPSEDIHHWSRKIPATSVTFSGSEFLLSFLVSIARPRDQPREANSQYGIAFSHMESLTVRWIGKNCQGGAFERVFGDFVMLLKVLKRRYEDGFPLKKFVWQYDKNTRDIFSPENLRWRTFCSRLTELGTEVAMECITSNG